MQSAPLVIHATAPSTDLAIFTSKPALHTGMLKIALPAGQGPFVKAATPGKAAEGKDFFPTGRRVKDEQLKAVQRPIASVQLGTYNLYVFSVPQTPWSRIMASQGSQPSVARCALLRATVRAPFRSLIAVRVNAQANVWFQPSQPFIMLYSIHYLLHKVGLLEKPGPEPGDKDKGAARDRTDGPVTEHGSASTLLRHENTPILAAKTTSGTLNDHYLV